MNWRYPISYRDPWAWWDEGTAVFMESYAYPANHHWLRYLLDWANGPETSLDSARNRYQSGLFLRFLVQQLDENIITEVWENLRDNVRPIDCLTRALKQRTYPLPFVSSVQEDLFASGYCAESYFLFDPQSKCFFPKLLERFGCRAVTQTFDDYPVQGAANEDVVDHLACRYYRFRPAAGSTTLRVRMQPEPGDAGAHLKAELIGVTHVWARGNSVVLKAPKDGASLEATLSGFAKGELDHAVLVVANCSCGDDAVDGLHYSLSAEVSQQAPP